MWKIIKNKNPIWYFDSTGNIIKRVNDQKLPYYYSIVCHDNEFKQIIEIYSFVTTNQNVQSVSKYLDYVSCLYDFLKIPIAPIFVVDFSWVLINSILRIFK